MAADARLRPLSDAARRPVSVRRRIASRRWRDRRPRTERGTGGARRSPARPRMNLARRIVPWICALLAVGLVLTGCEVTGTVYAQREDRQSVPVGLAPLVVVDTFNGRITVTAGGEND